MFTRHLVADTRTPGILGRIRASWNAESVDLTLGVLRTLTRFTQTHFLPLDLTGVAGNETGLAQFAAQGFVVFHQRTGDTVTDGTSLTGDTATLNSDVNVELFSVAGQFQRLTHDHACSLATEELIESAVVDGDIASTRTDRKSTRLNSSHVRISYAVFCLKKKKTINTYA